MKGLTMWRSADGRFNTVAAPSPALVLGDPLAAHVSRVVELHGYEALDDALELARDRFHDNAPEAWQQSDEDAYEGELPDWSPEAVTLADDPQVFVDALTTAAGYRWTLDVLDAVEDAAEKHDDG